MRIQFVRTIDRFDCTVVRQLSVCERAIERL
jgi:hypothetical protein